MDQHLAAVTTLDIHNINSQHNHEGHVCIFVLACCTFLIYFTECKCTCQSGAQWLTVVECLSRDRGVAGSSLTSVTAVLTGSTQEDPLLTWT